MLVPLTVACLMAAAASRDLPPQLLVGILDVEGGKVGFERQNSNGTRDLGPMQVNTLWVTVVAKAHGVPEAEVETSLRDDGCYNVHMAAWILRRCIEDMGDQWTGVGCYHSRTPELNNAYQGRVRRALTRLYGERRPSVAGPSRPRMMVFNEMDGEAAE